MRPRDLSANVEYVPGRGVEEVAVERGLDPASLITLSSNENALGPSPAAIKAICEHADQVHRYPKSSHTKLREALADRWDVSSPQVWVANGGDGALDYLSRALLNPGDPVLVPEPGFAYYGMAARFHHGTVRTYPVQRESNFAISPRNILASYQDERIIYVTSPHNPTGQTISLEEIEMLGRETDPDTFILVDEAYAAFSTEPSAISLVTERDDIGILRSFSKSHGLAGLRLGYLVVPDELAGAFSKVNTPFATGELACRAGLAALNDAEHLEKTIEMVTSGRRRLQQELTARTWPSQGNFVLVDVGDGTAVTEALFDRGVIVRDCTSFGLPRCIRITVAPATTLDAVIPRCNEVIRGDSDP